MTYLYFTVAVIFIGGLVEWMAVRFVRCYEHFQKFPLNSNRLNAVIIHRRQLTHTFYIKSQLTNTHEPSHILQPHTALIGETIRMNINCRHPIYLLTYLLTCLLTPWCRVLLEKLTGLQLVKKFPAFHGTRRFITAITSVRQFSLSWASPIQSIYPHPTSWRSVLILSIDLRLGLPNGLLPSGFPTRPYTPPSPHPYAPHAQPISFF